jgi:hypothetical protein
VLPLLGNLCRSRESPGSTEHSSIVARFGQFRGGTTTSIQPSSPSCCNGCPVSYSTSCPLWCGRRFPKARSDASTIWEPKACSSTQGRLPGSPRFERSWANRSPTSCPPAPKGVVGCSRRGRERRPIVLTQPAFWARDGEAHKWIRSLERVPPHHDWRAAPPSSAVTACTRRRAWLVLPWRLAA